jgi:cobalamin biosynthesis Mg chelatase CobN
MSTLTSKLSALQSERTGLSQKIVDCQKRLAEIQAARSGCKRTIGWSNSCLDTNNAQQAEQNSLITTYTARIAAIDLEIPKIQAEIAAAQKAQEAATAAAAELERLRLAAEAEATRIKAAAEAQRLAAEAERLKQEALANPAVAQIQANAATAQVQAQVAQVQAQVAATAAAQTAQLENKSEEKKSMMYIGAGIVALVIVVVAVMFILKK